MVHTSFITARLVASIGDEIADCAPVQFKRRERDMFSFRDSDKVERVFLGVAAFGMTMFVGTVVYGLFFMK
jgi:hypothetical protein